MVKKYVVVINEKYIPEASINYFDSLEEAKTHLSEEIAEGTTLNYERTNFIAEVLYTASIEFKALEGA